MTTQENTTKNLTTKRIILYLVITFILTYLIEFGVIWPLVTSDSLLHQQIGTLLVAPMMFLPAIGVLITRLITKEGFRGTSHIVPKNSKKSIPYFLMGYFLPVVLTTIGAVIYFIVFPDRFDPNMGYLADTYAAQGIEITPSLLKTAVIAEIVAGVLLAPLLNFFTCFGEEWGWRGYLLPKMQEKLPMLPLLLINGIIWGLWHAPLTILGHNYSTGYWGYPITGILAMCGFCVVMGIIFTFITVRTGSCLPAVLAHGSVNGFASAGILFLPDANMNPFVGPAPTGIIGGIAFIICAIIMAVLLIKKPNN